MGYRRYEPKPKPKNRSMQDLATPIKVYMHNGTTAHLAVPCYYHEVLPAIPVHHHSRPHHDHCGWPDPHHPDHSCQDHDFASHCDVVRGRIERHRNCRHVIDMSKTWPIHLTDEGYDEVICNIDMDGVTAEAQIDEQDDWIIRVSFSAACSNKSSSDGALNGEFAIYVSNTETGARDLVSLGFLTVFPANFAE